MFTCMETLALTYEGIGKDMTIHRYPRHRRTGAAEHVQYRHHRRQAMEQNQTQIVYRQKPLPHTPMQPSKDTARKTSGITNLETENDRAKEDPTGTDVQQGNIPVIQPTNNPHEEKTPPPPPLNLPHRQKPHASIPQTPAQPESTQQHPIPADLLELAQYINDLPRNPRGRRRRSTKPPSHSHTASPFSSLPSSSSEPFAAFPSRNILKRDPKLKGAISRKTGCLLLEKTGARLREWEGDERVFSKGLWRFLTEEGGNREVSQGGKVVREGGV
ncbi:hypothetical protein KC340_g17544 [Hortaea werneckii]|nr:hypothetical protein KC342_g11104 [Hortaea werneckii]KAI7089803.1 hypothetical protein KC339_g12678 [Hortaea werneckii]KAI7230285.1 hypothetical protein KC365_g7693 [Hortaea werneckii]KAI7289978.1 hypothetical protein KC340_g17544 [Hortaea werneckii]KAI7376337.1 hypothetical protein KC328_g14945 [Hortaea werneckii]